MKLSEFIGRLQGLAADLGEEDPDVFTCDDTDYRIPEVTRRPGQKENAILVL